MKQLVVWIFENIPNLLQLFKSEAVPTFWNVRLFLEICKWITIFAKCPEDPTQDIKSTIVGFGRDAALPVIGQEVLCYLFVNIGNDFDILRRCEVNQSCEYGMIVLSVIWRNVWGIRMIKESCLYLFYWNLADGQNLFDFGDVLDDLFFRLQLMQRS